MKRLLFALPALALLLTGCSTFDTLFGSGDKTDYRSSAPAAKTKSLEVPPDLTQLARDNRYLPQGGVISAAANPGGGAAQPAPAAGTPTVALQALGEIKVERDGTQRWLLVPMAPEQLWPQVRAFWLDRGFTMASENVEAGVMETDWAENRARLPQDLLRSTIGRFIGSVYDTGERDRYRTRIERTAGGGSEVYISHRGMEEYYVGERKETTNWRWRSSDPALEAEFLTRLMTRLSPKKEEAVVRTVVANAPEQPARARTVGTDASVLEIDEPFDRAWRRVGLALDRGGFTVEDRDRAGGLYFVRYVDPKYATRDEPGWLSKLFGGGAPRAPDRYRVTVKGSGTAKTMVSVLAGNGTDGAGEAGRRIVDALVTELR